MKNEKTLENVFTIVKNLFWVFYILTILGVWSAAPKYLNLIDEIMKILVVVILLLFFNPWKKTICTDFHRQVVFSSAIFLLFTISFKTILQNLPELWSLSQV